MNRSLVCGGAGLLNPSGGGGQWEGISGNGLLPQESKTEKWLQGWWQAIVPSLLQFLASIHSLYFGIFTNWILLSFVPGSPASKDKFLW